MQHQLLCTMKDTGLCGAGRSFVEVRNEQETTLNRSNGNLTFRCTPAALLRNETCC